jgi:aminoglycoside phosphotransferase (APT) family kinase protein
VTRASASGRVRPGEALDVAAVDRWLRTIDPTLDGLPDVTQYSGGASNWTYRLRYANRDLVLRRPPAGTKARSAHDMTREFRIQQALKPAYPLVPTMVALCQDPSVIGTDFYVMERVEGLIPRARLPEGVSLGEDDTRRLCTNVLDALVALHRVDHHAVGLDALSKGQGYARRQVNGWSDRYEKARTWNVPSYGYVRAWLAERVPEDVGACVIHNDWRFDNVVLDPADPTRVVGVLDWEMATIGDPLMDLGCALAYWVQADDNRLMRATRRQPTHLPGMLRRDEVVEYYLGRTGLRPASWTFYEVFGLFRLAVIAQQIYYRYFHRQTRNPAFRHFWILVTYFDWRCRGLIRRARG